MRKLFSILMLVVIFGAVMIGCQPAAEGGTTGGETAGATAGATAGGEAPAGEAGATESK